MPFGFLSTRSTGDLLVMLVAGTVCFSVMAAGGTIVAIELIQPEADTTDVVRQVSDIINTLIGLLAGFLAGRTDAGNQMVQQDRQDRLLERQQP